MRYANRWEMPEVTFYQVEGHGFEAHEGKPLFCYGKPGATDDRGIPKTGELYDALDRALVAWVAEKYTGPRGAGGTGVGTAADWFMRMIGADQLVAAEDREVQSTLQEVLHATQCEDGPLFRRTRAITAKLESQGLILARQNNGGLTADGR
jgi:hypothetical protein